VAKTSEDVDSQGVLYLVGTPIGNLDDITFRAIKILKTVDLIAAEDTRHTGKLLAHFEIKTPQVSYYQHNQNLRIPELISALAQGKSIALVSDAGMPGISDPGYELVCECIKSNIQVTPIPGVSASITGLVVSGFSTERFVFEGFLPSSNKERKESLQFIKEENRTIILYEAPHRLLNTLNDLLEVLGETRNIAIARELTKLHEELWRGNLKEAIESYQDRQPRGEYTLIVQGNIAQEAKILTVEELKRELKQLIESGMTRSKASQHLAQVTTFSRQYLYKLTLDM
jgi:16S rRNA (cytidine1402-2'-O)-methyltransferase